MVITLLHIGQGVAKLSPQLVANLPLDVSIKQWAMNQFGVHSLGIIALKVLIWNSR